MAGAEGVKKLITLKSSDGDEFEVEEAVAMESSLIRHIIEDPDSHMFEDVCVDNGIPLHGVNSRILSRVIEYCNKHLQANAIKSAAARSSSTPPAPDEDLKNWDAEFVKVDQATLFDLISAASFLGIQGLLELTCQVVADIIKCKTPEEIRKTFNVVNDFTPDEGNRCDF